MRRLVTSIAVPLLCVAVAAVGHLPTSLAAPAPGPRPGGAEHRLRSDANGDVRVHRGRDGDVDFVASTDSRGIVNPARERGQGPTRAARAHLRRYGAMLGLRAEVDTTVVKRRHAAPDEGSVVTFQQEADGVPVLGGEVVVSLDEHGDLQSILAETSTTARPSRATGVSEGAARRTARAVVAKTHDLAPGGLRTTSAGLWFYDPALIGATDPLGAREVWRFEVGNGTDVRELVLVDASTGRVALHFNQVAHVLRRGVCDNRNIRRSRDVACTRSFARGEGWRPHRVADVNQAYRHIGATYRTYRHVAGVDLTRVIGRRDANGVPRLSATVRWCYSSAGCPMRNAFWNGRQVYFGKGFAAGDDVVGHELTHGVIQHRANLLYFHQSGAINESIADVMGEIVDHRHRRNSHDSRWVVGEDLPRGFQRNMRYPARSDQPSTMTSRLYWSDENLLDNGGVHINSGVGNKTAYLISQGGSFNGQVMRGIDRGDPALSKSARLWIAVIHRLTSGSDYADLGRVLSATCDQFAGAGTAGMTAGNCTTVRRAVRATELARQPRYVGSRAPEAPTTCPEGTFKKMLYRDDFETSGHDYHRGRLWSKAPRRGVPENATSGTRSWFGLNPDPSWGDPYRSALTMADPVHLPAGQRSYLHFRHWYALEWAPGRPSVFYDGGFVHVRDHAAGSAWLDTADHGWVNGPRDRIVAAGRDGFGGDSNGYVSSRLNLDPWAGKTIRARWFLRGDRAAHLLGWFVDDVTIYTCPSVLPSVPQSLLVQGELGGDDTSRARLTWQLPARPGTGLSGYLVTLTDGSSTRDRKVGAATTQVRFDLDHAGRYVLRVAALNREGDPGPAAQESLWTTALALTATGPDTDGVVTLTGSMSVFDGGPAVGGRAVEVQRRPRGSQDAWQPVATADTGSDGAYQASDLPAVPAEYRAVFEGGPGLGATVSPVAAPTG